MVLLTNHSAFFSAFHSLDSSPCEPAVVNAKSCNNIETDLVFFLKGQVDPDRAAYSGYAAIEAEMTNDGYIGIVSTVEKIVYLSPLPLPVPPQPDEVGTTDTTILISQDEDELVVSPWTIGACESSPFIGCHVLVAILRTYVVVPFSSFHSLLSSLIHF